MIDTERELNRFVSQLRDVCGEHVLREKWLLAPGRRVGFQWTDRVVRSGRPVFNVRVKTLLQMVLEIASPLMAARGAGYLRGVAEELLVSRVFETLRNTGSRYLRDLEPGPGLTRVLRASIRDLRVAGFTAGDVRPDAFETRAKGHDVFLLLGEYERRLEEGNLLDYAGLLRAASGRLEADPGCLPEGLLVLAPERMVDAFTGLEKGFWKAVPASARKVLGEDRPGEEGGCDRRPCDAALLGWILDPARAPRPAGDGTADMFRAVGEVNEVREVFRRCAEEGIPLDRVEILYTDRETYVPIIQERAWNLGAEDHESLPVTFAEGVSPGTSRPGRALAGWLAWIREGFPRSVLAWMIRDGLLDLPGAAEAGWGPAGLAEIFRTLPVGAGDARYLPVLDAEIRWTASRLEGKAPGAGAAGEDRDEDDPPSPRGSGEALGRRLEALKSLRSLLSDLLLWAPPSGRDPGPGSWLEGTALFLERRARRSGKFDEYCHEQLLKQIRELMDCLGEGPVPGLDVPSWLEELSAVSRVGGLGPRPGCLHAAPLHLGGHAGRSHTFIVGLDDQRFPGAGLQDPLLLDAERQRISAALPTASGRVERRALELAGLLARLRGHVTLGYSCRNLADDHDRFPSPLLLAAYRILSGNREGVLRDMLRDLPGPVSFAPESPERCPDTVDWWLWRTCSAEPPVDPEQVVARHFPHLGRGFAARDARRSDRFTAYDGYVPEAAADADPTRPDGPVMSPSRLELLGACPMDYFFRYVLGIEPPEEVVADPRAWLTPAERGQLLHEVFRRYMERLCREDGGDHPRQDEALMFGILEEEIDRWKAHKPLAGLEAFQREVLDLRDTARIFLLDEAEFCTRSTPRYFEVAVGLPSQGEGSPLDSPEPVTVRLPGGARLRVRGRIDRVDLVPGGEGKDRPRYSVWDYKTGSSWKYTTDGRERNPDPFDQGRVVQNFLYLVLARERLAQAVSPHAVVERFGYFFPGVRANGERISWTANELAGGPAVLARLCRLPATGCFPFTDTAGDVSYSAYRAVYGDPEEAAAAAARKIANPANRVLEPFRRLRGYTDMEEP